MWNIQAVILSGSVKCPITAEAVFQYGNTESVLIHRAESNQREPNKANLRTRIEYSLCYLLVFVLIN